MQENIRESGNISSNLNISVPYFDHRHASHPVVYDVLQATNSGWSIIGQWTSDVNHPDKQLTMAKGSKTIRPANRLRVTTIVESPFVYFANKNDTHPSKLQGYCVDLLAELSRLDELKYELHLVKDGLFGGIDAATGQWNGMIGEVLRGEADMAVGSITLTEQRAQVVDFLPPFVRLDLKFLVRRSIETSRKYNPFAFLYPFDSSLYQAIVISVILLAVFISCLSKVSPYGIRGSFFHTSRADAAVQANAPKRDGSRDLTRTTASEKKLQEDRKDAERGMGLNNAFYFVWAALFWQTPERVPRSVSARIITVTWYLAAVIFVASYTANLVTIVSTHHGMIENNIHSIEDLMLQTSVAYGTVENSAVQAQLKHSRSSLAFKLYRSIVDDGMRFNYLVSNVSSGIELVTTGTYALIWDSLSLDYVAVKSQCSLKTVNLGFGTLEYAIAISKSSPHYKSLTRYMLSLKENGFLQDLWDKYFHDTDQCERRDIHDPSVRPLTFKDLAGVFYLVFMAMGIGLVVLILEWFVAAFYDSSSSKPNAPTMREAIRIRAKRLAQDIRLNWLPIDRTIEKWSKLSLPSRETADKIVRERVSDQLLRRRSLHDQNLKKSRSIEMR